MKGLLQEALAGLSGYAYLWTLPDKKTRVFPATSADEMERVALELTGMGLDVYWAPGVTAQALQATNRAKKEQVTGIGCLWADIDIADNAHAATNLPPTVEDALALLPADLPASYVVHSGHGLHAYWLLDAPQEVTDANRDAVQMAIRKLQQLIRRAAEAKGWKIDGTADLTRVLRVPGTWNRKDPNDAVLCQVIDEADVRYPLSAFAELAVDVAQAGADRGTGFERRETDGTAQAMLDNCAFLQHCRAQAASITYDEWVSAISNLARATDGRAACHAISAQDPGRYDPKVTEDKIDETLQHMSPRSCGYIQNTLGFRGCGNCPVKCPSGWSLAKLPQAVAKVRRIMPRPDEVFTPEVQGALALVARQAPAEYKQFRERMRGQVNLNDISKFVAEERRREMHVVATGETAKKSTVTTTQARLGDCPIDLRIPAGFSFDLHGIKEFRERADGSVVSFPAAGVPAVLSARVYNLDSEMEKIEVCFKYFNQWRKTLQQRSTVFSSRSIVKLSDVGLNVSSETAKHLVKYFQQMEAINTDRIPLCYSVAKLGWRRNGEEFILPCNSRYRIEMDDEGDITEAMTQAGTLAGWLTEIGRVREHTFARLILSASFATPLLQVLSQRNFLLYFWGTSGGGKTAAMKAAVSVWGNPERLMTSFLTTRAGLERRLSMLSDLPVAINERQVAGSGKEKQEYMEYLVYMLEGGKGKGRASKTGLQKTAYWRTIGMANGEEPLTRENSVRGVKNRILELNTYPVLPDDLARSLHRLRHYGTAGPAFVERLIAEKPQAIQISETLHRILEERYSERNNVHIDAVSCIATADALVSMWLFGVPQQEAIRQAEYMAGQVLQALPTADELSDTLRTWEFVQNWIAANRARFDLQLSGQQLATPLYGFLWQGRIAIFPAALRQALQAEGISYEKTIKEFGDEGRLHQSIRSDGFVNNTKLVKYLGKPCRAVILNEVLPEEIPDGR